MATMLRGMTHNTELAAPTNINGRSFVAISDTSRASSLSYYSKRAFDMVLALVLLVVLAPVLLFVAFLIKRDSNGPALFLQQRVGSRRFVRDGEAAWEIRNFRCFKFRTMYQDADQKVHEQHIKAFISGELEASDNDQARFKLTRDPRVTRIGHFLRKTSLDELPQLINVLRGEMSLIGPRPVPTYEVAQYQPHHYERLGALPGISGLWQVKGRSQVSFEDMVDLDIEYVQNQSLFFDIKIMVLTVLVVLRGDGAA